MPVEGNQKDAAAKFNPTAAVDLSTLLVDDTLQMKKVEMWAELNRSKLNVN